MGHLKHNYTNYRNIDEMGEPSRYVDGKAHHMFSSERYLLSKVDKRLVSNFNKVAEWIAKNCPNLNGEFECEHRVYYWIRLSVEDGKAYLETGSHGWAYDVALSATETASDGAAFKGIQFFRNDRLEEFLKQWQTIKSRIIAENEKQTNVYSDSFVA
jgi:hypothetical protein